MIPISKKYVYKYIRITTMWHEPSGKIWKNNMWRIGKNDG